MAKKQSFRAAARRLVNRVLGPIGFEVRRVAPGTPPRPLNIMSDADAWLPARPAPFVLAASNHGPLIVNRHDYHAVGDSAYGVGHQILNSSCFDYAEIKLALSLLSKRRDSFGKGVIAIDCGANIGVHTIEWARHMADWGSVVAIEAQERLFYCLSGNIAINNCLNARAIWAAVGAKAGEMQIPVPDYCTPASFGSLELRQRQNTEFIGQKIDYRDGARARVRVIAIDDLPLERVDLLKIDVEGMEMDVLNGAERTIGLHRPPIIVETVKSNHHQIASYLEKQDYICEDFAANFLAIHRSDTTTLSLLGDRSGAAWKDSYSSRYRGK